MKRFLKCFVCLAAVALALGVEAQGPAGRANRPGLLNRGLNRRGPSARQAPGAAAANGAAAGAEGSAAQLAESLKDLPKGTNGVPTRLAFDQAPIELLLYAYADVAGKILLPSPNLPKTQITLKTFEDRDLTKEEYLEAIEVTLTMHGVVIQPFDKIFLRAFERKSVRTQGIRTTLEMPADALNEKGKVVSQLIRLQHITAEEAQKAIEGFKDPNAAIQVFERNNTILVTDTQENVNRMLEVIRELDVANPVLEEVFVRQIENALATDIKTALETIVTESQKDAQQTKTGPKDSGAPGFGRSASPTMTGGRLLNLNRPGQNNNQPPPVTPNAVMTATVSDADRGMIRGKVLIIADERSNKLIIITMKSNMNFFDTVIKELDVPTTPEVSVEVIRLKYADAEDVSSMLNDLIGNSGSSQSKNNQNAAATKGGAANKNLTAGGNAGATRTPTAHPTFSKSAAATLGELNKDNIKILADKRINGIVIMARKADMKAVKEVVDDMDVKLSQVLIETVIIEVNLGDSLNTGIDWVQRGRERETVAQQKVDKYGRELYWKSSIDDDGNEIMTETTENTGVPILNYVTKLNRDGFYNNGNYMLGGGGGSASSTLGNLLGAAYSNGTEVASVSPIGSGVNYFLKSDKLNLAAIIQATKSDNRAKYIASPIVMTVDNKEATIDATSSRQFLTGWQSVSSSYGGSLPSPTYSSKDIGITLKITPKINPNGTVMLEVSEEYSQLGSKQDILMPQESTYVNTKIDVPVTRKMEASISLENRQSVILGGLTTKNVTNAETGIPILKDIPWIGKWLFGKVEQTEDRSELLIFMTPYVLDDASAAQFEALRRKKTLSDPKAWDDNGWSASPLADPVSKKEVLRRFQDEWAKQDEERKTQLAIEKAKMERAKKLKEMSKEEREFWLKLHKEELEDEEKEAFEKTVKEQKELKTFVDELKAKDLEAAEKEVKAAEKREKNEYTKEVDRLRKEEKLPAGEILKKDAAQAAAEETSAAKKDDAPPAAVPAPPAASAPQPDRKPAS